MHAPLAVRQREQNNFTDIINHNVRGQVGGMCPEGMALLSRGKGHCLETSTITSSAKPTRNGIDLLVQA